MTLTNHNQNPKIVKEYVRCFMDPRVIGNNVHFFLKIFCEAFSKYYFCNSLLAMEHKKEALSVPPHAKSSLLHLAIQNSGPYRNAKPRADRAIVFCVLSSLPPPPRQRTVSRLWACLSI